MNKRTSSPALRAFQFLGSVQFTMFLLLGGALAMIAGTIVESQTDTITAQATVYKTGWFDAYLVLIGINLVVSVINRLPIQRHQWAFVLTHLSIVLLLVGAWLSRTIGYEGQLWILEGSGERFIVTDAAEIQLQWGEHDPQTLTVGRLEDPTGREFTSAGQPDLRIEAQVPHGVLETTLAEGTGGPGVEVHIDGKGLHTTQCLIGEHRALRRKDLGPVDIELLVSRSPEFLEQRITERQGAPTTVKIRVAEDSEPVVLRLPADLARDVELAPGLHARVLRSLRRARVAAGTLSESPTAPVNPAAIVQIRGEGSEETHTVFSEFPAFNMIKRGDGATPLVAEVRLHAATTTSKPLISLIVDPAGEQLYVQLSAGADRGPAHPFEIGKPVVVGNIGIDLRVLKYLPNARPEHGVRAVDDENADAWLRFVAEDRGQSAVGWLRFGEPKPLLLGEHEGLLSWGRARRKLPFTVALDEFEIEYHPGSRRPSQYRSRVTIRGEDGIAHPAVISMNRPLDHEGFRLFQSSYSLLADGQRDATFLSVSWDPGVPFVYPAFILMVIGVGWYLVGHGRRRSATAESMS